MSEPAIEAAGGVSPAAEGIIERFCRLLCVLSIVVMIGVVGLEIVTRALFNHSFQISDEMAGYMLICLAFFSLSVTQANDGFHRVEVLQNVLPPRWQLASRILFDLVTLAFALVLIWLFYKLANSSFRFGSTAPTLLGTPLWIPQTAMVLGMAAFVASIVRTIVRNAVRLRRGEAPASRVETN